MEVTGTSTEVAGWEGGRRGAGLQSEPLPPENLLAVRNETIGR